MLTSPSQALIPSRVIQAFAIVLILLGLIARVVPVAMDEPRLTHQWPTEDGYLMLTISRNMALGYGMSTSDGEIATNGTQPLATWIWSHVFRAVDGHKIAGLTGVLILEILIASCALFLLFLIAKPIFQHHGIRTAWATLAAATWFSSTLVIGHSMNALETGLYGLLVVCVALLVLRIAVDESGEPRLNWRDVLPIGGLLSICFYARNDAVFLIGSFCVAALLGYTKGRYINFGNLPKVLAIGTLTVLLSSPWLYNNLSNFGHLMPISGVAQSMGASFGENISRLPVVLTEYFLVVLPIPRAWEPSIAVQVVATLFSLLMVFLMFRIARVLHPRYRTLAAMLAIYAVCLSTYYGFLHGAEWFLDRYLYPISPFLALLSVGFVVKTLESYDSAVLKWCGGIGLVLVLLVSGALNTRTFLQGEEHQHMQVVDWVRKNVSDEQWVGAVQTGTVGYFHDRTVNLDGKVNPQALAAATEGRHHQYVLDRDIVALADWSGITIWHESELIKNNYRICVDDKHKNLGVLVRNERHLLSANACNYHHVERPDAVN